MKRTKIKTLELVRTAYAKADLSVPSQLLGMNVLEALIFPFEHFSERNVRTQSSQVGTDHNLRFTAQRIKGTDYVTVVRLA